MPDSNGNGAIPISRMIKAMIDSGELTPDELHEATNTALKRVRIRVFPDMDMTTFQNHYHARGNVDRLKKAAKAAKKDGCAAFRHELAMLSLRMPILLDDFVKRLPPPWDTMPRGSRIVIVLGMRPFVHEGAAERLAIDQHDHMAFAYLNAYFSKLRSNCRIESVAFPRQMTVPEAMHELQELESCKDVGALIVVGSSVSNPATVPMARMILPVGVTAPPAQLHWMFPLTNPPQREDPLSDDTYGELRGMSVGSGNDAEFFARDDRHDAGMVLLRRKSGKRNVVTALLAGHGGHGTYASARAVTQPFDIAERLVRSGGWDVEPDYAFAPIAVETGRAPQGQGARWRFITPDPDAEERWFDFKLRSVNCSAHAAAMPEPAPVG